MVPKEKQGDDSNKTVDLKGGCMIDVGGHRLYMRTSGSGSPAVIMEGGVGMPTSLYGWFEQGISSFTTYCTYDRAGLGRSEESNLRRDPSDMVKQLHVLLAKAGVPGPYILMGHSLGGLFIRTFASCYPEEVGGLVFLDSSHPEQNERLPRVTMMQLNIGKQVTRVPPLARLFWKANILNFARRLPPDYFADLIAAFKTHKHLKAAHTEFQELGMNMAKFQAINGGSSGNIPMIVFSTNQPEGSYMVAWSQLQKELATLSSQSMHQIIDGSTHATLVTNQEYAQQAVAVVGTMVENIRAGKPAVASQ